MRNLFKEIIEGFDALKAEREGKIKLKATVFKDGILLENEESILNVEAEINWTEVE